jgi:hypothetical protein
MSTIAHILGLDNGSGGWYLFWSGFGANFSVVTVSGAMLGILRKHNCEIHGCWRLGRHTSQISGHTVCRKHLPTGPVTIDDVT